MRVLMMDLRHAWRMSLRQPVATLSIIALLALGIGGITAVFNPIYSTIFAPLPFPQPEQLARISGGSEQWMYNNFYGGFQHEDVLDQIFSHKAVFAQASSVKMRIAETGKELETDVLNVTESFFEMLGVKPLVGSLSCGGGNHSGYVISHRFWRREFAQKPDAIGSYVFTPGVGLTPIVGIMPEKFNFPFNTDIWRCDSVFTAGD